MMILIIMGIVVRMRAEIAKVGITLFYFGLQRFFTYLDFMLVNDSSSILQVNSTV